MPDSILEKLQKIIQFEYDEELDGFTVLREEELCGMITSVPLDDFPVLSIDELRRLGFELLRMADKAQADSLTARIENA
jgi:hypothetical protein